MNKQELDILLCLNNSPFTNQRELATRSGYSLGLVNSALKNLVSAEFLNSDYNLTKNANVFFEKTSPKKAVILAAGAGIRMVPIHTETHKALLEIKGETLIERQIKQLHAVGVKDITVVSGYLKERLEFLIDKYDVSLVYNPEYFTKNNLYSLYLVRKKLENCYVVPCDLWCEENPFSRTEAYSWYMVTDEETVNTDIRVNRKGQLVRVPYSTVGNKMLGICYLDAELGALVSKTLKALARDAKYSNTFWEEALYSDKKMMCYAKIVSADSNFEINTFEQLRDIDSDSLHLKSEKINIIAEAMKCKPEEIVNIKIQKKGMTNRSFLFSLHGKRYIMRIPGEGTDQLINRREEAAVYNAIWDKHLSDDIIYINPENGYKITEFLEGARVCDPFCEDDVKRCMIRLRQFHNMKLKVDHVFDIFERINFYESLRISETSQFIDYSETKQKVFALKEYIDKCKEEYCLTHIDAVPDNFLFCKNQNGKEEIRLIDWEYSSMQDPHVDIAMFIIYAMYDREHAEKLIDAYFPEGVSNEIRAKIYCYVSACGLLWSNWCEYKRDLGVEFGEYSLRQYRYAKEYYKLATELINKENLNA